MCLLSILSLAALVTVAQAQSLSVVNSCDEPVFIYAQIKFGSTENNNMNVGPGATVDLGIMYTSDQWDGAINVGTGCDSSGSCTTGGPTWNGETPFSRAEFNFDSTSDSVTYDISLVYGYNVGMQISSTYSGCDAFACTISSGCPAPGPDNSCYSPCCSSAADCSGGALPAGGGGCPNNAGPGPNSQFYYNTCYNAYAFPDNDGTNGAQPADFVKYTCSDNDIMLTLCPGTTSNYQS